MPDKPSTVSGRSKTYLEKLQDPRWQRVRLAVMGREDFTCQGCGSKDKPLQVHHGYYERGFEPWDYPTDTLWCLCANCHQEAEAQRLLVYRYIGRRHPLKLWDCLAGADAKVTLVTQVLEFYDGDILGVVPSDSKDWKKFKIPEGSCFCCGGKAEDDSEIRRTHYKKNKVWKLCRRCHDKALAGNPSQGTIAGRINSWHGNYLQALRKSGRIE